MIINSLSNSFAQKISLAILVFVTSIGLAYLLVQFGQIVFFYLCVFFILLLIIVIRLKDKASLLVVLLVCTLPLQQIFLTTYVTKVAAQLSVLIILFYYWQISSNEERAEYLVKVKPLIFPVLAFFISFFLSYLASGKLEIKDWVFLLKLVGTIGYAFLACFYCNNLEKIKKILWLFILIGIIQLPVMYAQAAGWINNIPGVAPSFNASFWVKYAADTNATMIRYPGMFGDYELVAEYFDIMILICAGFLVFNIKRKEQIFVLLSILVLVVAGFYTGTRAFIWGLSGGLLVMLFFMFSRPGFGKKIKNFMMIGLGLVLVITILSKQGNFSGYIDRFLTTNISLNNYDSRNTVFTISFSLIRHLPVLGYGPFLMEKFNAFLERDFTAPHSLYLSMLLTAGYPGIFAIMIMIFSPIKWMLQVFFENHTKIFHTWALIFLTVLIFWTANEIKIEFIRSSFYMDIIFFLFGIITSFYDLARRNFYQLKIQETR